MDSDALDLNIIDSFLDTFIRYIDSEFGLLSGDVAFLTTVLIGIDVTLAALWWAMDSDQDVLGKLIKKVLYVGAFAFILSNFSSLGRGIIDTGSSTSLPGGGFANVEGVRKGTYSWTFGDLTGDETEALYDLQKEVGETTPLLVVSDPALTPGLRNRIRYGQLRSLKPYKRRNPAQTRWEVEIEDWL